MDGGIHQTQQDLDHQRQELLESLGLRFVRVSSQLVETNLPKALEMIRKAFAPHPLAPSPTRGEGGQEVSRSPGSAPLSLDGRGAGGEGDKPGNTTKIHILPNGSLSRGEVGETILPTDLEERLLLARRIVADRCLYGVDKNPLAVEMAKLSLWLVTLAKGRPFTFLDHALKWGDSLLGITRAEQIEYLNLNPDGEAVQYPIASQIWRPILQDAIAKRRKLESFSVNGIEDLQEKERLFQEAEQAVARLRFVGDYLIGRTLSDAGKTSDLTTEDLMVVSQRIEQELAGTATEEQTRDITALKASAERMLNLGNPTDQPPRKPFHWLLEFPEVFLQEDSPIGFSAIVGNPPFRGGKKFSTSLGANYVNFLVENIANRVRGSADLCAFFFLRSWQILDPRSSCFGLLATNTISQGGTREVSLDQLILSKDKIYRAVSSRNWSGAASVEVSYVWIRRGVWDANVTLNEESVSEITTSLTASSKAIGKPYRLLANKGKSFVGSYLLGTGFIITPDEAGKLISKEAKNKNIIFPYLNGEDLNTQPDQYPTRYVINFHDWDLEEASGYVDCFQILTERVKPFRDTVIARGKQIHEKDYWKFWDKRLDRYDAISEMQRILVFAQTSKTKYPAFVPTGYVYDQKVVVIISEESSWFSLLCSHIHHWWVLSQGSSLRTDAVYTPSDCFETFPFPTSNPSDLSTKFPTFNTIGGTYYTHRQAVMGDRQEGLTKTYNRFHDPNEMAEDIQKLRALHIEMDQAVAAAYGWQDLDLGHDFHPTKQGTRFTISETARREVLDRLLELNHQRYAEEVAQGLHDKKKAKGKGQKAKGKTSKKQQPDAESDDQQLKLL